MSRSFLGKRSCLAATLPVGDVGDVSCSLLCVVFALVVGRPTHCMHASCQSVVDVASANKAERGDNPGWVFHSSFIFAQAMRVLL